MTDGTSRVIVAPIDGSEYSQNAIEYLCALYTGILDVQVILCHILPVLPPLFTDPELQSEVVEHLELLEEKNLEIGEKILSKGKKKFLANGFADRQIETVIRNKEFGVARDICLFAEKRNADAIVLATKGRGRLTFPFMGRIAGNALEYSRKIPVWLVNDKIPGKNVLIGIDASENALRAADYAGVMLTGTGCSVTLFHSYRSLRRFLPKEVLDAVPNSELEKIWYQMAGQEVMPYIEKAKGILIRAGLKESMISCHQVEGSRSAAHDILEEARKMNSGTIILGRRGLSGIKELIMGSVTRKIIHNSREMTVCVV